MTSTRPEWGSKVAASGPLPTLERSVDGGLTFAPAPVPPSPVLELAAFGGRLYAGTEAGLFVLEEERWRAVPPASGVVTRILRLEVAHGALLATSSRHRYRLERGRLREVARGEIDRRGLPTGDPRLPLVEAGDGSLRLHDAEGAARAELFTSLPRASILAVALVGNRLLVGTSGLGLRAIDLQPALGVEAAQSRSSDSSRRR